MTVGVVYPDEADGPTSTIDVGSTLDSRGVSPVEGTATDVLAADPEWVLTLGESALSSVVRAGGRGPILAVDVDASVPSIPAESLSTAVDVIQSDRVATVDREVLAVAVDGTPEGAALFDAMLVTAEAARISEFAVETAADLVASIRADGLVLATPAGSSGYAADAGGAVVQPGTGVVSVVPVAPFVTNAAHWILDADDVTVTVERDEPVQLVLDGRDWGPVERDAPVTVTTGESCSFFSPPGHRDWHARPR